MNEENVKPRNKFIALLLSVLLPGLGQIYNGQINKAFIFYGAYILIPFILKATKIAASFYGVILLYMFLALSILYIHVDAWRNAKRQQEYILKKYNKWYFYILFYIVLVSGLWFYTESSLNNMFVRSFSVSTTSGAPTLLPGDIIVADMSIYNNSEPDYGDLVVFIPPYDNQLYIFRVVGKPNDILEINNSEIKINGKAVNTSFIWNTEIDGMSVNEYEEVLPNGHKHFIFKYNTTSDSLKSNMKNILVPSDCYYLLGDNRGNAFDSRYMGTIGKEQIKGKATYCYWGRTTDRINIDLR